MIQTRACPFPFQREEIRMGFSTAGGGPSRPQMNVTPLIDVLLVLIIVFMVVVIEQRPTGLQTELPQQPNPKDHTIPPPNLTIVIQIHHAKPSTKHPHVTVHSTPAQSDHLPKRLPTISTI